MGYEMFLHIQRVIRSGSTDTELRPELVRVDLICQMRGVDPGGHDEPCTELVLSNDETIICQGSFEDMERAIDSLF
jgi:hypothetical protein